MSADDKEYGADPEGMAENAVCRRAYLCGELPEWDREEYACEKSERERDDAATGRDE